MHIELGHYLWIILWIVWGFCRLYSEDMVKLKQTNKQAKKQVLFPTMVVHIFNPSHLEAEAGGSSLVTE